MGNFKDVAVIDVLVKPGDTIEVDGPLITLETEKATMDVPSSVAGIIEKVIATKGGTISPGDVVATVQVAAAIAENVDYFCVGPCWPTPTKPGRSAPGLALVRSTAGLACDKPWFAIGGIDADRLPEVLAAGARRIVVVRAITAAEDPRAAAQQLSSALAAAS